MTTDQNDDDGWMDRDDGDDGDDDICSSVQR